MPESRTRSSVEYYGLGQSGYTAGRVEGDRALGLEGRNVAYPRGTNEQPSDLGDDERFTGGGGRRWAPEDVESGKDRAQP